MVRVLPTKLAVGVSRERETEKRGHGNWGLNEALQEKVVSAWKPAEKSAQRKEELRLSQKRPKGECKD